MRLAEQWRGMIVVEGFQQAKLLETEMPVLITIWLHFCRDQILMGPDSFLQSNISRTQMLQRAWCHWGQNYKGNGGWSG